MKITRDYDEVKALIGGEVLATPDYFNSLGAVDWGYLVADGGVLPFYIRKKIIFTYLLFTTGVLGTKNAEDEADFLNEAVTCIKMHLSIDFIQCQHVTALFKAYPASSVSCRFGSYVMDLSFDEETLMSNIHTKHRNVIKKAEKDGILVSCDEQNRERCIALIQETLVRQHIPVIGSDFLKQLAVVKYVDYWIAEYNGEVHGAAIILWAGHQTAYYMFGGSNKKTHSGAMNLLHWNAIKKMKERGVKYYDFVGARLNPEEGSKYEGIQRFKSRFGGELKQGYLWKMPLNALKYKLFNLLLIVKAKGSYKGDVIDQERRRGNI